MPKLVAPVYKNNEIKELFKFADSLILMVPKYAYVYDDLELSKALKECIDLNIEPILAINRIFLEDELEDIKTFIDRYKDYKFLVSDLGICELFKEMGKLNNVIYDSPSMICNSNDAKLMSPFGFDAISMSNEIPLSDVIKSSDETPIFYQVFGRKLMFYSKRKLISLYKEYRGLNFDNTSLSLKEEKRNYNIPIYENENGVYCFRQYNISLLNELNNLRNIKYAYLESLRIDWKSYIKILDLFNKCINNPSYLENALKQQEELNLNIEEGFTYSDTIHTKEKIVE